MNKQKQRQQRDLNWPFLGLALSLIGILSSPLMTEAALAARSQEGAVAEAPADEEKANRDSGTFRWSALGFSAGGALLFEKNNEAWTNSLKAPVYLSLLAPIANGFSSRLEYSVDESQDRTGNVSVTRERQHLNMWLFFRYLGDELSSESFFGVPQIGLALAGVSNRSQTRVAQGPTESAPLRFSPSFAASIGYFKKLDWWLAVSSDLRFEGSENFSTNDGRWGIYVGFEVFPFNAPKQ